MTFLGYIVVASLALVMVLAAPVGWLADRIGPFVCVITSTICLSALFFALPFVDSKEILIFLAAPYGLGLVFFLVADLFLLIETLPDPDFTRCGTWNRGARHLACTSVPVQPEALAPRCRCRTVHSRGLHLRCKVQLGASAPHLGACTVRSPVARAYS